MGIGEGEAVLPPCSSDWFCSVGTELLPHQSVVELGESRASRASVRWGWCPLGLGAEKIEDQQRVHNCDHSSRILDSRF